MTNEDFILQHRTEDVRQLALRRVPEGVDHTWCMQQIEGWQLARKKLPRWAETQGVWFPPRLSMEQCSSEQTATYKEQLLLRLLPLEEDRKKMIDLTGGLGIDFSYLARHFHRAIYAEQLPHLCDLARHNMPLLGLERAEIVCQVSDVSSLDEDFSLIYLDPARRDTAGKKTVAIEDCTPDVAAMQDSLRTHARYIIIKLSPMLDITQALRSLRGVREVHVVSVRGECKELLLVISNEDAACLTYHCVNLDSDDPIVVCDDKERNAPPLVASHIGHFIYEPNASVLKAGTQNHLCHTLGVEKLHPISNLFTSNERVAGFPGRCFRITGVSDFSKQGVKSLLCGITQANLTVRNFPTSVAELRKKLKLKEGGDTYLFATTQADGKKILIKAER